MNTPDDTPDRSTATDDQLLAQFLSGHQHDPFAMLVRRHHRLVLGICERTLGRGHDADDAFQATFIVLARNAQRIRRRCSIASWLFGVAYRIASRVRRQRSRRAMLRYQEHAMVSPCPWKTLAEQEDLRQLDAELARLPDSLREPLVLRYLQGLDNESAAAVLGLSITALEGRLKRAKARMRRQLLRHGVTLSATLLILARRQQSLHAADHSPLIQSTIDHALTTESISVGTDSSTPIALRLAQAETLTMHAVRWSKSILVSCAIVSVVTLPIAVRQVIGQGVDATQETTSTHVTVKLVEATESAPADNATTVHANRAVSSGEATAGSNAELANNPLPDAADPSDLRTLRRRPGAVMRKMQTEAKIVRALDEVAEIEFHEEPLSNVVDYLRQRYGVLVALDTTALESIQVTADSPVTGGFDNVSLRSALSHLLRPMGATYTIRDEALIITSLQGADQELLVVSYRIEPQNGSKPTLENLAQLIETMIEPTSWEKKGGQGVCEIYDDSLVIKHCLKVHEQIDELLQKVGDKSR